MKQLILLLGLCLITLAGWHNFVLNLAQLKTIVPMDFGSTQNLVIKEMRIS